MGDQAQVFWRWLNFTVYNKPADKETVAFINLDESPCALEVAHEKGNIAHYIPNFFRQKRFYAKYKRGMTRSNFTFVGIISNIDAVQRALPQILLLNKKTVKATVVALLRASLPPNFHIIATDSHWMNEALMCHILCLIKISLGPLFNKYHCVFLADCCKLHITQKVFKCAARIQFAYVPIPAKTTWLLQPLDTHAFGNLKRLFRTKIQHMRANTASGVITLLSYLQAFIDVSYDVVVLGSFRGAFLDNGISFKQVGVSDYIRRELEWEVLPFMALQLPSLQDVASIFPRHWGFILDVVLSSTCPVATCLALRAPVPSPMMLALEDGLVDEPMRHRLRSHSRSLAAAALLDSSDVAIPDAVPPFRIFAPECVHSEPACPLVLFQSIEPVMPRIQNPATSSV
jgi:hypothetical protein